MSHRTLINYIRTQVETKFPQKFKIQLTSPSEGRNVVLISYMLVTYRLYYVEEWEQGFISKSPNCQGVPLHLIYNIHINVMIFFG